MKASQVPVITVDGPGGAGKGTLCQLLAQAYGFSLLDSGALYRLLALSAQNHHVALDKEEALVVLAEHMDVQFLAQSSGGSRVVLEGEDVSNLIRTEEVGKLASQVAAYPAVRDALLNRQRAFREAPGLVADGRDMGTVVFPDAELKVFLTASAEERGRRRLNQLKEKGIDANLDRLIEDIRSRDERDSNRAVAPMRPADDALVLDSTELSIDEVFERVKAAAAERSIA